MIAATLLALTLPQETSVAPYFPLVAGTRRYYEDTSAPGSTIEEKVLEEVVPEKRAGPTRLDVNGKEIQVKDYVEDAPFFPVEVRVDGSVVAVPCYRERLNSLMLVGNAPNKPIPPRTILQLAVDRAKWEYYGDNASSVDPIPVHVTAESVSGPDRAFDGKKVATVVVTSVAVLGGKNGFKMTQTSVYGYGVGLLEFTEDGTAGKEKVHHVRRLLRVVPPEGPRT